MAHPAPPRPESPQETDLRGRYVLVIVVEVLVIAALYAIGRHFS